MITERNTNQKKNETSRNMKEVTKSREPKNTPPPPTVPKIGPPPPLISNTRKQNTIAERNPNQKKNETEPEPEPKKMKKKKT
ncbi:hypothetical protein TSUD_151740 [Trifolium subterraneum]|uniref:Uncharacterized protein n=1 Tax=Trifolium subterraneum TaxID=3900 RepID=A0A2Z6N406_TRISU|nr:hypothetical protein TSUD_151740 [Trifolium subterraneum]